MQQVRYPSNTVIVKRPSLLSAITITYLNSSRPYNVHYTSNMHSQFHLELIFQTAPASHNEAGLWNLKTPFYLVLLSSYQPTIFTFYQSLHGLTMRLRYTGITQYDDTVYHLIRVHRATNICSFLTLCHYYCTELFTMITQLKNKEKHKIITLYFYVIFCALMESENNL